MRHRFKQLACVFCMALMLSGGALAAGEEHGVDSGASPFAGDLGNALWTLIIFVAVVLALGKFVWPPVLKALQGREQFIYESLASAKADREAAEARLQELEKRLADARSEASAIVDEGRRDAEVVKQKIHAEARAESDAMIERAKREIELARDTAVKELYTLTAGLATEVAGRIISKELSAAEHERLVSEAIESVRTLPKDGSSA